MVRAKNASAAIADDPIAKTRACRLFNGGAFCVAVLDANAGPIPDADVACVKDADSHQYEYEVAECFQCSWHNRSPNVVTHVRFEVP